MHAGKTRSTQWSLLSQDQRLNMHTRAGTMLAYSQLLVTTQGVAPTATHQCRALQADIGMTWKVPSCNIFAGLTLVELQPSSGENVGIVHWTSWESYRDLLVRKRACRCVCHALIRAIDLSYDCRGYIGTSRWANGIWDTGLGMQGAISFVVMVGGCMH